jgi:hypothetical protein
MQNQEMKNEECKMQKSGRLSARASVDRCPGRGSEDARHTGCLLPAAVSVIRCQLFSRV